MNLIVLARTAATGRCSTTRAGKRSTFPGRQPDRLGRHDSESALPGALAVLGQLKAWSVASDYRDWYNQLADEP